MSRNPVIAVDFDGTVARYIYPQLGVGDEIGNSISVLKKLQRDGCHLIMWTCRGKQHLQDAKRWCEERGLFFDAYNANMMVDKDTKNMEFGYPKVIADVYIDDRALDWQVECKREGRQSFDFTPEKWEGIYDEVMSIVDTGITFH